MKINELYVGTVNIPKSHEDIKKWLKEIYELGYRKIDTAWIYGNNNVEKKLGKALYELEKEENIIFFIQTKLWPSEYKKAEKSLRNQLKWMNREYFDSYMLHRPSLNFQDDINAWKKLIKFQKEGLIKRIGVSNYDKDMIELLIKETNVKPEFNQIELSITNLREDRIYYAKEKNIEIQAWSVMGKETDKLLKNKRVLEIAKKHNVEPSVIVVSYPATIGAIPIVTSLKIERMKLNSNIIKLDKEDVLKLRNENKFMNKYEETFPY